MPVEETISYELTFDEETIEELIELYPAALEPTEAVRMAVEEAMFERRRHL